MKRLAILISSEGTGSTLKAILEAIHTKKLQATVVVVMSDAKNSPGFSYAEKEKIPTHVYNSKTEKLEELLTHTYPVDYIVLAGWKKIVADSTIDAFADRILNLHPGLVPDTMDGVVKNPDGTEGLWNRGKFMTIAIQNFLDQKATYAGSSVHFLSHEFDFGKVLGRCFEKVQSGDTVESLYNRLKEKEHTLYIEVLQKLCN